MKKLLVLGATPFQVPIVRKAQSKGHYVITMDNIPGNHAHRVSDETALVSVVERDAILAFASAAGVDGIITGGSDVGVASLGYVCDHLGLPGVSHQQALLLTRKDLFRQFQRTHGFSCPEFHLLDTATDFTTLTKGLSGTYFLKPVDSSGSKGVTEIKCPTQTDERAVLEQVFHGTIAFSRARKTILERAVDGCEHGGDLFLDDGDIVSFQVTTKSVTGPPHYVPTGHVIPSTLPPETLIAVQNEIGNVIRRLDIRSGAVNFDIMVNSSGQVTILEMSPRFGGNCIPQVIHFGTGFDEIGAAIDVAMGSAIDRAHLRSGTEVKPTGSRILGCPRRGRLASVTARDTVLREFAPGLLELVYDVRPGDNVHEFTQGNHRIGHFIATAKSLEQLADLMVRISARIDIRM